MTALPAAVQPAEGLAQDGAARMTGVPSIPDCDTGLLSCAPGRLCACGRRAAVPAAGEVA
jgi:hypothetical protein